MILYSLVSFQGDIIDSTDVYSPTLQVLTRKILKQINVNTSGSIRKSYLYGQNFIHYVLENRTVFMCICETTTDQAVAFQFLHDISKEWIQFLNSTSSNLSNSQEKLDHSHKFQNLLNRKMQYYSKISFENAQINHINNLNHINNSIGHNTLNPPIINNNNNINNNHSPQFNNQTIDVPFFETIVDSDIDNGLNQHVDDPNAIYIYDPSQPTIHDPLIVKTGKPKNYSNEKYCFGFSLSFLYKVILVIFLLACIYTLIAISCHGVFFQGCSRSS